MRTHVFTLMYGTAWERYGKAFADSFARHWSTRVELSIVSDRPLPITRGTVIDMLAIPGLIEFRERWANDPAANGLRPPDGAKRDKNTGYAWRYDAVKWMPQGVAVLAVLDEMEDGDILAWFDADVETTSGVAARWLDDLIGDADIALLQRGAAHSEIGFIGTRINPRTRTVWERFANSYLTDAVFDMKQWHSAFVLDRAIDSVLGQVIDNVRGIRVKNLNPTGGKGHVWPHSPLAAHTVHKKGDRKDAK